MRRNTNLRLLLVAILSSVVAERGATQSTTAADGPWAGWARCELTAQAEGYTNQQTHTWVLTGTTPTMEGVFRLYPATWTVTGQGSRQRVMGDGRTVVEEWTTAGEPRPAPISVWIRGSDGTLRFTSRHAQQRSQAAATGTSTARLMKGNAPDQTTKLGYDVYEWTFPAIEDVPATATTVSGSPRPRPLTGSIAPGQPPGTSATEACSWQFVLGATVALLPPEPSSSSAAAATATSSPTFTLSAAGSRPTIQTTTPPPGAPPPALTPTTEGLPATGKLLLKDANPFAAALPVAEVAPPSGLQAETSPTRISLRWPCLTGPTGFDVYVTPQGGAEVKLTPAPLSPSCIQDLQLNPTIVAGAVGSTSTSPTYSQRFTHSGVIPGATYTYVVRALYPNGASAASTPITAMANLAPPPAGFVATASGRSAALQWQSVSGATGYRVFRKQSGQSAFQELNTGSSNPSTGAVNPTTATSYGDQTILPPGQHQYYVQAANGFPTQPATVTIPPWPAPGGLIAFTSSSMVDLQWNMVWLRDLSGYGPRGPAGYLVFRQRQSESGYTQVTATPESALNFQDMNPIVGLRVSYYVKGVDGDASAPVAVVPGEPVNITATPYPTWVVDLSWDGTSDATSVRVLRAGTPSGQYTDVTESDSKINWARIRSNPRGGTHYFQIVARYTRGAAQSAPVTVVLPSQGITNLAATSPSAGTAALTWTCDPFAIGYSLLRQYRLGSMDPITLPGSTTPLRLAPTQCQYSEAGLFSGEDYSYTVVAYYGDRSTTEQAVVYVRPK